MCTVLRPFVSPQLCRRPISEKIPTQQLFPTAPQSIDKSIQNKKKVFYEKAQTMPSNVPNTAIFTGTARTSVGASPRQKTREPDSAYIARAVFHVLLPAACARASRKGKCAACMRVLSTSNGNVTIQPRTPAAPPARSSAAHERCARASVSCVWPGAQRRNVASYCVAAGNVIIKGGRGGGEWKWATHAVEVHPETADVA